MISTTLNLSRYNKYYVDIFMHTSLNTATHWQPAKSDWLINFPISTQYLAGDGTSDSINVSLCITFLSPKQLPEEFISEDVTDAWKKEGEDGTWRFTGRDTDSAEPGDAWKYTSRKDGVHVKNNAESGSSGLEENGNLLWSVEAAGI